MGEITAISWADHTFNPWMGCTKVSPACDGCYAEALMDKRYGRVEWGAGNDRVRTSAGNWHQPIRWNKAAVAAGTRPFVFCASLADVFDNEVTPLWRRDLFALIEKTPQLVWLLLTKRVGNVLKMTNPIRGNPLLPRNAAVGATFANQEEYDRDRIKLYSVKQDREPLFTFGSFEPLLGHVTLDSYAPDWIISGGETDQGGHSARPSNPAWYRALRDFAAKTGRAYQHKQNGEFSDFDHIGMAWNDLPDSIRVQQQFVDGKAMIKVGKNRSGRLLDGVEHNGRPTVSMAEAA